jgi:hypothetical protein
VAKLGMGEAERPKFTQMIAQKVTARDRRGGGMMTSVESIRLIRAAFGSLEAMCSVDTGKQKRGSLADVLLAIQEKRGALYMRQISGFLIEKWDLSSDRIDLQSSDTLDLVARVLRLAN